MNLQKIVKEAVDKLNEDPNFNIDSFVKSKNAYYEKFIQVFEANTGFSPRDYKSYCAYKKRLEFDRFKEFMLKNNRDPLIIYIEILRSRLFGIITQKFEHINQFKSFLRSKTGELGLSTQSESFSDNDHNVTLYEVLDHKNFLKGYYGEINSFKKKNNLDFDNNLSAFILGKEKTLKITESIKKYEFIQIYKMFLQEILS